MYVMRIIETNLLNIISLTSGTDNVEYLAMI